MSSTTSERVFQGWMNTSEPGEGFENPAFVQQEFSTLTKSKPTSADDLRRRNEYASFRELLRDEQHAERLTQQLAYWAITTDRGLPFALLDLTVAEIIEMPFDRLASTQGVGPKKLDCLLMLLDRVANDGTEVEQETDTISFDELLMTEPAQFDPSGITETQWRQWCELVDKFNVSAEKLGRLAPSLQALPSVLWHKPLSSYTQYTLAEIRQLKTHGEKRVRSILIVFHSVIGILRAFQTLDISPSRLVPKNILNIETWIDTVIAENRIPTAQEIHENIVDRLIGQIRHDAGATHEKLVATQLGAASAGTTVRHRSRQLGLTRARMYQLVEDCGKVFVVRWPEASTQLDRLSAQYTDRPDEECVALIAAIGELTC